MNWIKSKLGMHITTLKGNAFKSKSYQKNGVPVVRVSDFTHNSICDSSVVYIDQDESQKYGKYRLSKRDIIIQTVGSWQHNPNSIVGKVVTVPDSLHGALLNQNAVKIIPDGEIDQRFLYYCLKGDGFKKHVIACSQGAANQASITLSSIKQFSFNYPDTSIQKKIAGILSAYDDLIENNRKRIKLLEEMAQNAYEEWFFRFKFPDNKDAEQYSMSNLPSGWRLVNIGDVCSKVTDGAHHSPESVEDGIPMASVKDMHKWGINISTCREISKADYAQLLRNDCKPLKDDILIAKDGSYLKHVFVVTEEEELAILSSIAILRPNGDFLPNQLALYLGHSQIRKGMTGYVSGAAIPRIILKAFKKFKIVLPPKPLQEKWAKMHDPAFELIRKLLKQNQRLQEARDILLPRLMTGMIDVDDYDPAKLLKEVA